MRFITLYGLIITGGFLLQTVLVVLGQTKTPILRSFRGYGEERVYYPVVNLLFWTLAFGASMQILLAPNAFPTLAAFITTIVMFTSVPAYRRSGWVIWLFDRAPVYPLWYRRLLEYTTRYERRHISYMWLRLSPAMKSAFNQSDALFFHWVDLIVLGTVLEEGSEASEVEIIYRDVIKAKRTSA